MLGSLTGTVTARLGSRLLVEVNGIGYWVNTGVWQPAGQITCYLHHHIREEASDLYGFVSLAALSLFEKLLDVSGIGPKAALALLSLGEPERLERAIIHGDVTFLSLAPGVGKKAAEKVILELRGKLTPSASDQTEAAVQDDLIAALEGLGYKAGQITPLLGNIPAQETSLEAQLKWILRQLNNSKSGS